MGAAAVCLAAGVAAPRGAVAAERPWIGVGVLAGSTLLDSHLSDFAWDVRPRAAFGAQAVAGRGPWSMGLRLWRATSTQSMESSGAESPDVALSSLELIGQRRLAGFLGVDLLATASAGGLWIGYQPDQVTFTPPGSSPIVVDLEPIHAWTGGGGLEVQRPWSGPWRASLSIDVQAFGLDATHRNGSTIETERESFGDWSARLGLAWISRRP
jgi:hypothetical protein